MQLIIDSFCNNLMLLTSKEELGKWLIDVIDFIGMTLIGGPYVVYYPAGNGDEKGLSGVVLLAESSIVVHTYPEYKFVYIDLFSCKEFNTEEVLSRIKRGFGMEDPIVHLLTRRIR